MNNILLNIDLVHFLILSGLLFAIGLVGVILNQKSIINVLLSVELMLLSVNINMVAFSAYFQEMTGQIFAIFILTVAAAEAAVGLAIIINYYRNRGSIAIKDVNEMQG
jgi:NADH-quinone oxidoreductase subunit K